MKLYQVLFLSVLIVLFLSCAGIPDPSAQADSLLVGNMVFNFPDGFFNMPPKIIKNHILVYFYDLNTETQFSLRTLDGDFSIPLNSGHTYAIMAARTELERAGGRYTVGENIKKIFTVPADSVSYIGHWSIVFRDPDRQKTETSGSGGEKTSWDFEINTEIENNAQKSRSYIKNIAEDSPWLDLPMASVKYQKEN